MASKNALPKDRLVNAASARQALLAGDGLDRASQDRLAGDRLDRTSQDIQNRAH